MRRLIIVFALTACGGSSDTPLDAGPTDGPEVDPPCVTNPHTHKEIINACTDAQKIRIQDLRGRPPKLNANGSLPPLPSP